MGVTFAILATNADVAADGRVFIFSGGTNVFFPQDFPAGIPVTMVVTMNEEVGTESNLIVSLISPDGNETRLSPDPLRYVFKPNKYGTQTISAATVCIHLAFDIKKPGEYWLKLSEREKGELVRLWFAVLDKGEQK